MNFNEFQDIVENLALKKENNSLPSNVFHSLVRSYAPCRIQQTTVHIFSYSISNAAPSLANTHKPMRRQCEEIKWIFRKTGQWKVKDYNFKMDGNSQANAMLIMDIQHAIDTYLKKMKH